MISKEEFEDIISSRKPVFRVIIAGGREFLDYPLLKAYCDHVLSNKKPEEIYIISGEARGADKLGEKYAKERGYKIVGFPADWDRHGKAAGYIRNEQMAKHADALIAFWDKKSKGTGHMIDLAKQYQLQIRIKYYGK